MLKFLAEWFSRAARIEFHFHAPVTLNVSRGGPSRTPRASLPTVVDITPRPQRPRMTITLAPARRERMILAAPADPARVRAGWSQTLKDLSRQI